jgi:uncharacterized integral membrane protein (TIGR00698 family)
MATTAAPAPPQSWPERLRALAPGAAVCFGIAAGSVALRDATGIAALSPVVVALLAGIALRAALGLPQSWRPGTSFAVRPVLRAAIVLLGLQVTLGQLWSLGPGALALAVVVVAATLPFTIWLGARLGVDPALSQLIGTGTAICGASAIVAANQVARARPEDVAYALTIITLFGTAGLVLLPVLAAPLGLDATGYGLWAGSALHEVVQAVGAAAAGGPVAAETGTVAKLARVALLAPAVLALGWWVQREKAPQGDAGVKAPVPWFAFGFLGMVVVASTGLVPQFVTHSSRFLVPLMLAASVAALGLGTDLRAVRARGLRPLLLGLLATLFIAALSLAGVAAL